MEQKQEVESPAAWRPEVGKTAWVVTGIGNNVMVIEGIVENIVGAPPHKMAVTVYNREHGGSWSELWYTPYPTADAALKSIKVYDLEGREVELMAFLPYGVGTNGGVYGTFGAPFQEMRFERRDGNGH